MIMIDQEDYEDCVSDDDEVITRVKMIRFKFKINNVS